MASLSFDRTGFQIDGEDRYLVSGEFHYFRVPHEDWERRMKLFAEAGGNTLATYVPWLIHEPEEGKNLFGDRPERDLAEFLRTAEKVGLNVVLRPGPYQYSELRNAGLPDWLLQNYPFVLAKNINGGILSNSSVSYLHPVFLEKARKYYKAFADVVRPFTAKNGGPVVMLQVDNEMTGIHIWNGSFDYNREAMGIGIPDGRYPRFLAGKYENIDALNRAYGTDFADFASVLPLDPHKAETAKEKRRAKDYYDFYHETIAEYAALLASWLKEDGLDEPICHNSPNPSSNCYFTETVEKMGDGFLLGSDHYYNLSQDWQQNNPTPQYALTMLMSIDELRALGMPPVAFELPGGSPSDTPPILKEDLLACYMANAALGLKGVNYYIYTGGPNFEDTGDTADIYDYHAHVRADGTLNETYASLKAFGDFMTNNAWMQRAERISSYRVAFDWNLLRGWDYDLSSLPFSIASARRLLQNGILYASFASRDAAEMIIPDDETDISKPLVLPCPSALPKKTAKAVVNFVKRGGSLLVLPVLPETDENYEPNRGLDVLFDGAEFRKPEKFGNVRVKDVGTVYGIQAHTEVTKLPEGAEVLATDLAGKRILGFETSFDKGKVIFFGGSFTLSTFPQARMIEMFTEKLGAKPTVELSNRNIISELWEDGEGRRMLFLMNLFSGKQSSEVTVLHGEKKELGAIHFDPMEVRAIRLS